MARPALAVAALLLAGTVLGLEVPPAPHRFFTDYTGRVERGSLAAVESRLAGIEAGSGHQAMAVLFESLEGEALEDFTVRCAQAWKAGRKGIDDGVIFFAFLAERRMRLEVGYGLEEKIPDAIASRLLREAVKPAFARGDLAGGVAALAASLELIFR
ncbi:MAG: TPM domain-containing protein, partial [Acidobacteriota bacterium]